MLRVSRTDERVWLSLISAARDPRDSNTMLAAVKATAGRVMPCSAHRDQAAFVALQALARAYGEGLRDRRQRLSGCLSELAEECARAIGQPSASKPLTEAPSWTAQDLFDT
jgi:hypothetical protein